MYTKKKSQKINFAYIYITIGHDFLLLDSTPLCKLVSVSINNIMPPVIKQSSTLSGE